MFYYFVSVIVDHHVTEESDMTSRVVVFTFIVWLLQKPNAGDGSVMTLPAGQGTNIAFKLPGWTGQGLYDLDKVRALPRKMSMCVCMCMSVFFFISLTLVPVGLWRHRWTCLACYWRRFLYFFIVAPRMFTFSLEYVETCEAYYCYSLRCILTL